MSRKELRKLHKAYLKFTVKDSSLDDRQTLVRILERAWPDDYGEWPQDAKISDALEPAALKKMRDDTYEGQVRPLLHATPAEQEDFLSLLKRRSELVAMLKLMDRYAREYGRSDRCRQFESRIKEKLETRR